MAEPDSSADLAAEAPPGQPPSTEGRASSRASKAAPPAPSADATDRMAAVEPEAILAPLRAHIEALKKGEALVASEASGGANRKALPSEPAVEALGGANKEAQATDPTSPRESVRERKSSSAMPAAGPPSATAHTADVRPLAAYELIAGSARLQDLASITQRIVGDAARTRASDWAFGSKVAAAAAETKLSREDVATRFGNALDVLSTGGEGPAERALAAALWAHAVAEAPRSRTEEEDSLAGDILWLATHTAFDATPLLDRALGEDAADLWVAIADRIKRIARGKGGALGRAEAVVGCAALAASGTPRATALCSELAADIKDPVLARILDTGEQAAPDEVRLEGQLLPAPRGPVATTLLALTGILFAVHAVRLFARVALAYRVPAEVSMSEAGIRVKTRTELLGRTLREREHVILRSGLVRVVREVRFPRAAFYAGLLALAVGSYVGVRAFADGVRAASPSLLVVGLVIVALGIGADFVLGTLLPGSRGRCRVAFVPRTGPVLCVGEVDAQRADDALARSLARR